MHSFCNPGCCTNWTFNRIHIVKLLFPAIGCVMDDAMFYESVQETYKRVLKRLFLKTRRMLESNGLTEYGMDDVCCRDKNCWYGFFLHFSLKNANYQLHLCVFSPGGIKVFNKVHAKVQILRSQIISEFLDSGNELF